MTRRRKVIILVVLIIVILGIAAWVTYRLLNPPADPVPTPEPQVEEQEQPEEPSEPTISEQREQQEQDDRNQTSGLQSLTKTFVQRYGSYSSEANFANLQDVLPLMTDAFAQETEQFIAQNEPPEDYYGVTTRVISIDVVNHDEGAGTATLRATTQREESEGSPQNNSIRYQDIVIEYELVGETWLVSDATWQ